MENENNQELRNEAVSDLTTEVKLLRESINPESNQEEEVLTPEEQERRNRYEAGKNTRYAGLTEEQVDISTEEHIQQFGATPVARAAFSMQRSSDPSKYELSECYVERNSDLERFGRL